MFANIDKPALLVHLLVLGALIAVPIVVRVELEGRRVTYAELNLPAADLLIWAILAVIVCGRVCSFLLARRTGRRPGVAKRGLQYVRPFSPELLLFVGVAGVSVAATALTAGALKELIQLVDYYLLWYWIVARSARHPQFLKLIAEGTIAILVLLFLLAGVQIVSQTPWYLVRSAFRDHQSFLAACVLLAPLGWCYMVSMPSRAWLLAGHVFIGIGSACLASLATVTLIVAQLWIASRLLGGRWVGRGLVVTGVVAVTAALVAASPYRTTMFRERGGGWFTVPLAERRMQVLAAKHVARPPTPAIHFGAGGFRCFLGSNLIPRVENVRTKTLLPEPDVEPESDEVVLEYFAESWAGLQLIQDGPLWGRGLGSWQDNIGTAFGVLERTGTSFPNTINGYLLVGATSGGIGLLAWYLACFKSLRRAARKARGAQLSRHRGIAAGCFAGLAGSALFMLVYPVATQPMAVYWVFLAAWAHGIRFSAVDEGPNTA